MKKIILLSSLIGLFFLSCKKKNPEKLTTQDLINQGKNIIDLLELRPADSLIGKDYKGGILFYVDTTSKSGLVVSKEDISENAWWGCNGQYISGVQSAEFGVGDSNTYKISTQCTDATSAAALCYYSNLENYQDWYLPSEDEMTMVYSVLKPKNVGSFADTYYWTSTQENEHYARYLLFLDGSTGFATKSDPFRVRAIRNVE